MRKYKSNNLAMAVTALVILWLLSVACGSSSPKTPQSNADGNSTPNTSQNKPGRVSIAFPSGTTSSMPEDKDLGDGIVERRQVAKSENAFFEVRTTRFPKASITDQNKREILEEGVSRENGKILDRQNSTFQGKEAIIIKSEFSGSSGSLFIKSVTFIDPANDALFAIRAGGKDKESLDSKTVNDFINSFKLEQ